MSKKKDSKPAAPATSDGRRLVGVAEHARAAAAVARAKSLGGLAGFVLGGGGALLGGEPLFDTLVRAVAGGIVCYLAVWGAAVVVWRQLLVAEVRNAYRRAGSAAAPRDGA